MESSISTDDLFGKYNIISWIRWNEAEETCKHVAGGIRFDPQHNAYFSWVSHEHIG